jgi:hypothetical protein
MSFDAVYKGKRLDYGAASLEEIKASLNELFSEDCEFDGIADGEVREDDAEILKMEDGEIIERIPYTLSYEGERSDYDEHNLNHRGGFI